MPSIAETKRQVKASLENQQHDTTVDHDAILASLQDEIDNHNEQTKKEREMPSPQQRRHRRRSRTPEEPRPSLRFRFKSTGRSEPTKRSHRSPERQHRRHRKHKRQHRDEEPASTAAHPFPREPTAPDRDGHVNPNAAFRESLFDALADDEGAAYWENVYSQPIHVYARPEVPNARGELEGMDDDQYAAYVQAKMWEKKHPHVVLERARRERERREKAADEARARDDFVHRKQRAAWERASRDGARKFAADEDEHAGDLGDGDHGHVAAEGSTAALLEYRVAWKQYLLAWDQLKQDLLRERDADAGGDGSREGASRRIPWPVLCSKAVIKPNIEDFMLHVPVEECGAASRLEVFKSERVKWHPDKVQQRFAGRVDDGTMKIVTGVFQVVDALLEGERKRA